MSNNKIAPGALLLAAVLLSSTVPAQAQAFGDLSTKAVYVDAGNAPHSGTSTDSLTLGVILPWGPEYKLWGTSITSHADLFVSQWRAPKVDHNGHNNFTQIGAIALWRFRFDEGASPWFAEAGIGVTQMNDHYESPDRRFSTRFQFTEQFAVGRNFGMQGRHELSLRVQHFSNGSIRKPNPGENFYKLRYAYRF